MITRALAGLLGIGLLMNAAIMLAAPAFWYAHLPGVAATGPLNIHFVRDIGCAGLIAGVPFLARAHTASVSRSAMVVAAGFLCLHMGVHVYELIAVSADVAHRFGRDFFTVYVPAFLAAWIAAPPRSSSDGE